MQRNAQKRREHVKSSQPSPFTIHMPNERKVVKDINSRWKIRVSNWNWRLTDQNIKEENFQPTHTNTITNKWVKKKRTLVLNLTIETGLSGSCCQLTTRNKRLAKKKKEREKRIILCYSIESKMHTSTHCWKQTVAHTKKKKRKKHERICDFKQHELNNNDIHRNLTSFDIHFISFLVSCDVWAPGATCAGSLWRVRTRSPSEASELEGCDPFSFCLLNVQLKTRYWTLTSHAIGKSAETYGVAEP